MDMSTLLMYFIIGGIAFTVFTVAKKIVKTIAIFILVGVVTVFVAKGCDSHKPVKIPTHFTK